MKKKSSVVQYIVLWCLLAAVVAAIWAIENKTAETNTPVSASPAPASAQAATPLPTPAVEKKMKGIWVPYMSLQANSGEEFKKKFADTAAKAKAADATALFVHVRPFSDALYPSELYPWSHLISGKQGDKPDFDPLQFMIDTTHENGMEFHAWVNPLRVKLSNTPAELAENNPYTRMKDDKPYYFIETASGIYLNPAYSEVRGLISGGVKEIVENYDVDGVHFDDYFYPSDMGGQDELTYMAYLDTAEMPLSLNDWRTANINALISEVYRTVKNQDENLVFGISPQGNPNNNALLGADVEEWVSTPGYIDYIAPQLYFSYDNPALGYSEALEQWMSMPAREGLKKYIGLALYKIGTDSDENTWPASGEIIDKQIADAEKAGADGVILYDIDSLEKYTGK